jgi:predicted permease
MDGGIFNAWLTESLKKIGQLFVTLQVVVVGVSLSSSLRKMKRGEQKALPWAPTLLILVVRLVLWPVLSIAIIWGLCTKTNVLSQDPILWFAMMM